MTGTTYETSEAAQDAADYAVAQAIMREDPSDADAAATVGALDRKYGEGFFE